MILKHHLCLVSYDMGCSSLGRQWATMYGVYSGNKNCFNNKEFV